MPDREHRTPDGHPRWYGRRHGRPLRAARKHLFESHLPEILISLPEEGQAGGPVNLPITPDKDLWLEVGFGNGEHLAGQAADHPDVQFIGCEPFVNGVASLLAKIDDAGIDNIHIYDDDVRRLFPYLPDACLGRAFVLFSDPWPKRRHAERRFINDGNLDTLARLLKDGAELRVATDDVVFLRWALQRLVNHPAFEWTARRRRDWEIRPEDAVETRYEAKAIVHGRKPAYLRFCRRPRP